MEKSIRRLFFGLLIGMVSLMPFRGQGQEKSSPLSFLMDLARDVDVTFLSIPDDKFQWMPKELGPAFQHSLSI